MVDTTNELLAALRTLLGSSNVLTGESTKGFAVDWTGRFANSTSVVVRPHTTDQVSAVLALAHEHETPVVPQGGNTGLVGGGVPLGGELVLSLTNLTDTEPVDTEAAQVTVGAGVTIGEVQKLAAPHGLTFGVDIASRDSATVGGAIATNAGGLRVMRYGDMAAQVVGLEAVLADGTVISHLDGLTKDNTGYRWHQLLLGSEGTLAVVTRARLRLVPRYTERAVALLALEDIAHAITVAGALRRHVPPVEAIEVFLAEGVELLREQLGNVPPFRESYPVYVLVEAAGHADPLDALLPTLSDLDPDRILLATTEPDRRRLWQYRERHTEAINTAGVPRKLDVAVPLKHYAAFADELPRLLREISPDARPIRFGHIADGNLHVNVLHAPPEADVDGAVFELVASFGGSISAEHGIGNAKKRWLHLNRSEAELRMARQIKNVLDPRGILNPNVLFSEE